MNAITAVALLNDLSKTVIALQRAIEDANDRQDIDSRYVLQKLLKKTETERDALHEKLRGISL